MDLLYRVQRQSIVNTCLSLSKSGFLAGLGGNVAMRLSNTEFAVTPSAADYYTMTAEDICILNLRSLERIDDNGRPASVESGLHAALFLGRPDLSASIHTHQPIASAVTLLHLNIPIDTIYQSLLGSEVKTIQYAPSGSKALVQSLKRSLQPNINGYLLPNHGIVCAAKSLTEAMNGVAIIEKQAASFLLTLIRESQIPTVSASLMSKIESHLQQAL
ncbi:MAG: class II aldolase/adducin family protein [Leptonema sp. (in: Bacteria)]|nr:class II aldolase/adducin family protein [Leptonema sp. (in: bacteria)]